jgi:hypothetical protein
MSNGHGSSCVATPTLCDGKTCLASTHPSLWRQHWRHKGALQLDIAFSNTTVLTFVGRFIASGTDPGPANQLRNSLEYLRAKIQKFEPALEGKLGPHHRFLLNFNAGV